MFGQDALLQRIDVHNDDSRVCGNVWGFCEVFISRVPRSSYVSRDFEKMLSRFFAFEPSAAA